MKKLIIVLIIILLSSISLAETTVPEIVQADIGPFTKIPIQGRLLNSNNIPLTGSHTLGFSIYNTETLNSPLFTETISSVTVTNGLFSVILGEDPNNPLNLDFSQNYYVEISVNGETLSPRQKLLASPYAISAKNVYGGQVRAIDARFAENVGIGTDTPTEKLDVSGNIKSSGNVTGNQLCIGADCKSAWPESTTTYWTGSGNDIYYNNGNIGVGTLTPSARLDVNGGVKANEFCIGSDCRTTWPTSSSSYWTQSGNNIYYENGNVGIGTSNPATKLEIAGGIYSTTQLLLSGSGTNLHFTPGPSEYRIGTITTNKALVLESGFAKEVIRLNPDGKIGIGISTPSAKLDINGTLRIDNGNFFNDFPVTINVPSNQQAPILRIAKGGSVINVVDQNGNLGLGTFAPTDKLDVNGIIRAREGIKFGDGTIQTSAATSVSTPKIIGGTVLADGTISDGTGFTVLKLTTGRYQIFFNPAFSATPAITITTIPGSLGNPFVAQIESRNQNGMILRIYRVDSPSGYSLIDTHFTFIAIK